MITAMEELLLAAVRIQASFLQHGWRFCFIGGVAVQRWGNPRFTQDLDITLLTGFGEEKKFVDVLLKELIPRRPDAGDFALRHRVLLAKTSEAVDVDIAFGALPFEERSVARASAWQVREGLTLTTCSAEDLVVHKAFAGRGRDWDDVESVLIRQHARLNLQQIREELKPLLELKGEAEALDKLEQMEAAVDRRLRGKP
jgi:hypothetical protein